MSQINENFLRSQLGHFLRVITVGLNIVIGTTILTDGWRAYRTIAQRLGGQHTTINHTLHYVDPRNSLVHTNTVERRWRFMRQAIKCYREGSLELHVLMAVFRATFLMLPFDASQPKKKRTIKNCGDALEIVFEAVKEVYPGLWSDALQFPARTRVPVGAHPFPGKVYPTCLFADNVNNFFMQSSVLLESEAEGADPADSSGNDDDSEDDSEAVSSDDEGHSEETDDPAEVSDDGGACIAPPAPSANPAVIVDPLLVALMSWEDIDGAATEILRQIATIPGVFLKRLHLEVSFMTQTLYVFYWIAIFRFSKKLYCK